MKTQSAGIQLMFDRHLNLLEKSKNADEFFTQIELKRLVDDITAACRQHKSVYVNKELEFTGNNTPYIVKISGDKTYAGFLAKVYHATEHNNKSKQIDLIALINNLGKLMLGKTSFSQKINQAFDVIGAAVEADRIYLFKNYYEKENAFCSQIFEWTKGHISKQIENPVLNRISYDSFPGLKELFEQSGQLHTKIALLQNAGLREVLEYQDILSVLLTPVFVEGKLWGFVGYDNCTTDKLWEENEVSVLKLFASLIESVIYREQSIGGIRLLVNSFEQPAVIFDEFNNVIASNGYHETHCELYNCPMVRTKVNEAINDLAATLEHSSIKFSGVIHDKEFIHEVKRLHRENGDDVIDENLFLLLIHNKEANENNASILDLDLLEKNKELESVNGQLNTFVNRISHDLKAPVRNIRGFAKLMVKIPDSEFNKQSVFTYISFMEQASARLERLVEALAVFSKASQQEVTCSKVDIKEIVDYWYNEYKQAYGLDNIVLLNNINHHVFADKELISIAFANIISNAIKYSSKAENPSIVVSSQQTNGRIEIVVEDNGCGFDMKYYNKVFGFLQRLHSEGEYSGSGVGLSTVKKIIEKHKGDIWLSSKLNKGTKVFVVLNSTSR